MSTCRGFKVAADAHTRVLGPQPIHTFGGAQGHPRSQHFQGGADIEYVMSAENNI